MNQARPDFRQYHIIPRKLTIEIKTEMRKLKLFRYRIRSVNKTKLGFRKTGKQN